VTHISFPRASMYSYEQMILWVSISLEICVLTLIWLRGLSRSFPFFTGYTIYVVLIAAMDGLLASHARLYFYFYWNSDAIEILLSVAAIYESFARVFKGLSKLRRFQFIFAAAIFAALGYSVRSTYEHPPDSRLLAGRILISAVIDVHYVLACLCILFFLLAALLRTRARLPEFGIVLGFGFEAAAFGIAAVVRSEFGTKYAFWSNEFPTVAYIAAGLIWLRAVWNSPETESTPNPNERLADDMRHQVKVLRRFLQKR
jgi:hypothetical protein